MSLTSRIQDQKDHITQVKKIYVRRLGFPVNPYQVFQRS